MITSPTSKGISPADYPVGHELEISGRNFVVMERSSGTKYWKMSPDRASPMRASSPSSPSVMVSVIESPASTPVLNPPVKSLKETACEALNCSSPTRNRLQAATCNLIGCSGPIVTPPQISPVTRTTCTPSGCVTEAASPMRTTCTPSGCNIEAASPMRTTYTPSGCNIEAASPMRTTCTPSGCNIESASPMGTTCTPSACSPSTTTCNQVSDIPFHLKCSPSGSSCSPGNMCNNCNDCTRSALRSEENHLGFTNSEFFFDDGEGPQIVMLPDETQHECETTSNNVQIFKPPAITIDQYTTQNTGLHWDTLRFVHAANKAIDTAGRQLGEWIVVGLESCAYCKIAKMALSDARQTFYYLDQNRLTSEQIEWITDMGSQYPGKVPKVFFNGNFIGGSSQLKIKLLTG